MNVLRACTTASLVKARQFGSTPLLTCNRAPCSRKMMSVEPSGPAASMVEGAKEHTPCSRHRPPLPVDAVPTSTINDPHPWHERFEIKEDRTVYKRYLTVYDRAVTFTLDEGQPQSIHYDVVGHPTASFCFAVAIPFHPASEGRPAQVTMVREYAQGPNVLMYCFPSGGFDKAKHADLSECAQVEMAEESMLVGGEVVALLPADHPGQSELKWSRNTFKPFLIIDPKPAPTGHAATRDAEEHTIEALRMTIPELRKLIAGGQVMLPSVYAFFLAQDVLQERQLI